MDGCKGKFRGIKNTRQNQCYFCCFGAVQLDMYQTTSTSISSRPIFGYTAPKQRNQSRCEGCGEGLSVSAAPHFAVARCNPRNSDALARAASTSRCTAACDKSPRHTNPCSISGKSSTTQSEPLDCTAFAIVPSRNMSGSFPAGIMHWGHLTAFASEISLSSSPKNMRPIFNEGWQETPARIDP
eukprot:scaffold261927_cov24-Tisochrysis_lutea.AAC.2